MADHSKPTTTSLYTDFVTELDGRLDDLARGLDPATTTPTNVPTDAIRWSSAGKTWEKWNGSSWVALSSDYAINLAGPSTVSANSASAALTIAQTGTGNALVVEDSTSPDASPFVIDANGNVINGHTAPLSTAVSGTTLTPALQQVGANTSETAIGIFCAVAIPGLYIAKSQGTIASPTTVNSGNILGRVSVAGHDGTSFVEAGRISFDADAAPSTGSMPGRLVFSTTADGSSTPTERMRIDSTGRLLINQTTFPAGAVPNPYNVGTAGNGTGRLQISGNNPVSLNQWAATGSSGVLFNRSPTTTPNTGTGLIDGDDIGYLLFNADDGANFIRSSAIIAEADGATSTGNAPGRLVFQTSAGGGTLTERLRIDSEGRMDMRSNMTQAGSGTASSISGVTLTVGGTVAGAFAVGDRIFGAGVEPNTFITALGTGTGGAGTYTINNSQTVASTTIYSLNAGVNTFRFTDTDAGVVVGQPMGQIEWYGSDTSTPGAGVKAYITAIAESGTPDTALIFGTSDNVASTQAVERVRISSTGLVTLATGSGLQIASTAVTSPAASDGNVFSGTYQAASITLTNGTNVTASTATDCQYVRIGNVVTISGAISGITTTAAGNSLVSMSIPVASNFGNTVNAAGAGAFYSNTFRGSPVAAYADTANDRITFNFNAPSGTTGQAFSFSVTYKVI